MEYNYHKNAGQLAFIKFVKGQQKSSFFWKFFKKLLNIKNNVNL